MKYQVRLVADAEEDLIDLYEFIARTDSIEKAEHLHVTLLSLCKELERFPTRGHITPELRALGIENFRELHFKSYRIIYEIIRRDVFIHCILDGRRDMENLLSERLLRG